MEAYIPNDLSFSQLPLSFHYYDPLLAIIQQNISNHKKEMAFMKERVAFEIYNKLDSQMQLKRFMGIDKQRTKLSWKYNVLSEGTKLDIDHHNS